jgi:hypothetical protein
LGDVLKIHFENYEIIFVLPRKETSRRNKPRAPTCRKVGSGGAPDSSLLRSVCGLGEGKGEGEGAEQRRWYHGFVNRQRLITRGYRSPRV